ncbi:ABC-2 transporter permease [Halalkalibacillus halophilus]|uniref:ABC-2 transporter permease n=1 Tax=Halalkalibacillus halophilus TaxID=392827 RepID=UPI00040046F3|nr:ABC-2 transporter permease [Halalkalibacillus halophilus]
MKGLMLNQYYSVEKSILSYVPLALLAATILIFFENPVSQRLAAFIPVILMATTALEVLKHESKSGWNKYVLTLPVKRSSVVNSHYLFFAALTLTGLLIACIAFLLAQYVLNLDPSMGYMYAVMNILGITFTLGFIAYPLTYLLGTEKAEFVIMIGGGAGLGLFFLSAYIYEEFLMTLETLQRFNPDFLFSASFMVINAVLFILSYIVSIQIYKRKEF